MTQQSRNDPAVESDAATLEGKFGDLATVYAENRSEAAELRGADEDAEHWRDVAEEIDESERKVEDD